jgi:hypothetical protein
MSVPCSSLQWSNSDAVANLMIPSGDGILLVRCKGQRVFAATWYASSTVEINVATTTHQVIVVGRKRSVLQWIFSSSNLSATFLHSLYHLHCSCWSNRISLLGSRMPPRLHEKELDPTEGVYHRSSGKHSSRSSALLVCSPLAHPLLAMVYDTVLGRISIIDPVWRVDSINSPSRHLPCTVRHRITLEAIIVIGGLSYLFSEWTRSCKTQLTHL